MKVFEFQFNPAAKKDRIFKAFASGNLFVVGELANVLPQNSEFLTNISKIAKSAYDANKENFQGTIRAVNEFLQSEAKAGNVDWLGNLHLALFSFSAKQNNSSHALSFAKIGNIKILMARRGEISDLGSRTHDLKKFVSGRIGTENELIVCTKELFDLCTAKNFFHDLAFFTEEKQFRELFSAKEKELSKISGILFSVFVEPEEKEKKPKIRLPKIKIKPIRFSRLPSFAMPRFKAKLKLPVPSAPLLFFCLLVVGFFFFRQENIQKANEAQALLQKAKSEVQLGNYSEAWKTIAPIANEKSLPKDFVNFKDDLAKKLLFAAKWEEIKSPQLFFEVKKTDTQLIPHSMVLNGGFLYLSNPFAPQLLLVNLNNASARSVTSAKNLGGGTGLLGFAAFFADPNSLLLASTNAVREIALPLKDFHAESMGSFGGNLYLFDSSQGKILKIADPLSENPVAANWLDSPSEKKAQGAKSIAIDGQIWLLNNGNEIQRYYQGTYQATLQPALFPILLHGTRLKTSWQFQYLYLLDPSEKRLVILSKDGKVVKQYYSPAFNALLDVAVSADEHTVYLLNGFQIFVIRR